jgi:uncharacterized membrane protein (UPF0127 family)
MNKAAKSNDPAQQKLRDDKRAWNTAKKELIKRIIGLSQGLNGKGNPSYGLPPSNIKDPLPPELVNFLDELSSNFQQLAQAGVNIIQEQTDYSQNRRQPTDHSKDQPKIATASLPSNKGLISINGNIIPTLLALTAEEQQNGLMHEKDDHVMTFVYSSPQFNSFWMKSTPNALDLIFSLKNKVIAIKKGEPFSTQLIHPNSLSDLIVELPYGKAQKLGIKIGDDISLIRTSQSLAIDLTKKYASIREF